ncbi:hypothetical protein [Smaragdicoccus niigatensis]|uniref:hypothetical protein n=1 Tax=Smaragdicoccus niigatensis TaxID=359359 RepID=UPI0003713180|nr:hypothetical protein [Smaragdicoccus niigatensis]
MGKTTTARRMVLGVVATAIGVSLLSSAPASAKATKVCTTIPAHDIIIGKKTYPARPGSVIHVPEKTVCRVVFTRH